MKKKILIAFFLLFSLFLIWYVASKSGYVVKVDKPSKEKEQPNKEGMGNENVPKKDCQEITYKGEKRLLCKLGTMEVGAGNVSEGNYKVTGNPK